MPVADILQGYDRMVGVDGAERDRCIRKLGDCRAGRGLGVLA